MSRVTAWYVSRAGDASGPFATDMVVSMLRDGTLQPLDLVFREGETEWRPAATYRELKANAAVIAASDPRRSEERPEERKAKPVNESMSSSASSSASSSVDESSAEEREAAPMKPAPQIGTARPRDPRTLSWIVLRPHSSTYLQEGPFETQTIIDGLQTGRFQFSQYAWHIGMNQWMRIGDLREFDRRSRARDSKPHVPPPLPDPIAAVLLEDDKDSDAEEFHVMMRGVSKLDMTPNPLESMQALNVTQLGRIGIGGAAAESPEEKATRAVSLVVSTPNLAGVPWEQDASEGYAQATELIDDEHSGVYGGAHGASGSDSSYNVREPEDAPAGESTPVTSIAGHEIPMSSLDKTPPPFVPAAPMPVVKDGWEKWGRPLTGVAMFGVLGVFAWHLVTNEKTTTTVGRAKVPASVRHANTHPAPAVEVTEPKTVAASPEARPSSTDVTASTSGGSRTPPVRLPSASAPADFGVVGLKLDRPDGQILIQGALPANLPVRVTFKGRLGQILSKLSVRKTVSVQRKGGEIPTLRLKDLKLPAGAYTVEVDAGGAKAKNEIFIGTRDAKFLDRLETHLREVSLETQTQKKALFYASQELNILARELGQNYGQLRDKPEMWSSFFGKWSKKVDSVGRSLSEIRKKKSDEQAYPEETASLLQALVTLNDVARQYVQAIGQKRDVASDALTDLITELTRQNASIGEATARPTADTPDGML